ncbi:hypothetical protein DPSP01_011791 [Paraphaeosphaeria sporulosa]|uniref:Uncharacterized protein n=1 Tax=Paraphaeosphaeria sporulosa TaxID=1460663 RepID=A0A177CFE7_9PLEO|nr:uncharacterized protein CC84DRAFT_1091770 [Paraphaeosphaeria sporulosa]OAG06335.1 hypothetical protein CC84DRAFT_1091770 [Paraphaeosphaeria sporulosa]
MVHWLDVTPEYNTSPLIPLCFVTVLSSYGLYMSYQNITRLQEYEDQAQKLSKWSNTVAARLNKTRTTQTSGTIAMVLSTFCSLLLLLTKFGITTHVVLALICTAVSALARLHMKTFWNEKEQVRIPLMGKFNEAVSGSEEVVQLLGGITAAWIAAGLLSFF